MKIREVQREKITGNLEDVMCRCRRTRRRRMYSAPVVAMMGMILVGGMLHVLVFQG